MFVPPHVCCHWPWQEGQEEVTATGITLGVRQEPGGTCGAVGVGCAVGVCGGSMWRQASVAVGATGRLASRVHAFSAVSRTG